MKRLKLFFACLLMAVLSIGQVWAASPDNYSFSSFTSAATVNLTTTDGFGITLAKNAGSSNPAWSSNQARVYAKGSLTISIPDVGNYKITSITYTYVVNKNKSGVAPTIDGVSGTGDAGSWNSSSKTWTASGTGATSVAFTTSGTAGNVGFTAVSITYTTGSGTVAVSNVTLDESAITLTEEETQTLTATVLPDNATNKNVTWESDDESVATVANGVVTAVAAGDATITCKSAADETKYAECAVHVNPSPYTKSTLIFTATCGGSGTADDDAEWEVESDGTESAFDSSKGIHYGTGSAEVQYITLRTSDIAGTIAKVVVNASTASGVSATVDVTVDGDAFGGDPKSLSSTATDYTFTGSASGEIVVTVTKPSSATKALYVKSIVVSYIPSASVKKPTFSVAGGSYLEAQSVEINCATDGANIYYTLDGTDPSSSSTPYTSAITISETKTLKAIAIKGDDSSPIASAIYTITTPLSVSAAIALIPNANDQVDDQFVEGYVCTAGTSVSSGQMTYYISADGSETDRLQIYKGKNLNNADFSEVGDLAVGDKVVVFGQLKNYSGTKEMNSGNYIVRRTAKGALSSVVVSGTPTKTEYSADEAFEPAGLVVTATYASGYAVNVASELAAADWSADPATVTAEGDINVTATYGGKTSVAYPVHVTVLAATLDHISLSYDAVEVYQGKPLPKPVVTAHWSDATESDVTALAEFTGYDAATPGDQEITVSYTFGGDTKEETYTVTVNPIYNVELTVSVAKDLIETVVGNTKSTEDMIVRGTVSQENISNYKNRYKISDGANELLVYAGKGFNSENFTNDNYPKVGDVVVVKGKVINYNNNTPEFATGESYLLSQVRPATLAIENVVSLEVGADNLAEGDLNITTASDGDITFVSGDDTKATIVANAIHAVAPGTVTITANLAATENDNALNYAEASTTFTVTVVAPATKYTITFDANGATGGSAPTAIPDKAAGAEVTLPENSYAWPHYTFTGWKVYDANEDEVTVNEGVFVMPASNVTIKAQWAALPVWAYTYTSNVTLSGATASTVVIGTDEYDAMKAGSNGASGSVNVAVPANATTIHFHASGWKDKTVTLNITTETDGVTISPASVNLTADAGITGSGTTYTLQNDPEADAYFSVALSGNTEAITLNFANTGSGKQFVLFGVNQEGGVLPVLDHIAITGTMTNTTGWKTGDEITPEGLTVNAYYTLNEVMQDPVDVTNDPALVWSHAALVENQTEVTLTATYTDGVAKSANVNVTIAAVETGDPTIITDPALYLNFGASVVKDAVVAPKTITVTLKNITSATATLGGTNFSAFSIDNTEIVDGTVITVSVNTATPDTYAGTVTIKDNDSETEKVINLSMTVVEPETPETAVSTTSEWVAATAEDLVDGAEVLITGATGGVTYAIGVQNDNNRAAVAGTLEEGVFTPGENTMSFTLVAQETEGVFALQASNGEYLYAASSAKNYLKRQATLDDNAKWTLTVTSAVANGSNTHNDLKFNATNSPKIFSCYASGQTAIQFYVPKPATPPTPVSEDVRTGLEPNRYYTICLPKNVTAATGATFWNLQYRNEGNTEVYLEEVTLPLEAGKPYIFQAAEATLNVTYGEVSTSTPVENGALRGTLVDLDIDAFDALPGNIYILKDNAIRPRKSGENFLSANRAYIDYDELESVSSAPIPAPGKRVRAIPMQGQTATGMDNVQGDDVQCTKVLIDGQMYILRANRMYDVTGKLVK